MQWTLKLVEGVQHSQICKGRAPDTREDTLNWKAATFKPLDSDCTQLLQWMLCRLVSGCKRIVCTPFGISAS